MIVGISSLTYLQNGPEGPKNCPPDVYTINKGKAMSKKRSPLGPRNCKYAKCQKVFYPERVDQLFHRDICRWRHHNDQRLAKLPPEVKELVESLRKDIERLAKATK